MRFPLICSRTVTPYSKNELFVTLRTLTICGCAMHIQFLLAALNQAMLGRGRCAPNPSVGAVAVQNNAIIAQAWHHGAGTPHAEQLLLNQFPEKSPDVTLYVTLEPCNHWGRTPPCVESIIQHGIQRVVYAYQDPNPIVSFNKTPDLLRNQGIDVVHWPLPEIDEFYRSYRHWTIEKMPWVTVKIAQTLDGKIAGAGGERILLSNAGCSEFTHYQRLYADVILTTARTVHLDDPLFNVRLVADEQPKPVAIIDRALTLDSAAHVFKKAKQCHVYHDDRLIPAVQSDRIQYHGVAATEQGLDLESIICHLGKLGYHDVFVEAGGTLFSALHKARLVNRTYLYLVPSALGPEATPAYLEQDVLTKPHKVSWQAMDDNMILKLDW